MQIQKDTIRQNGLRVTPARLAVLNILNNSAKPMDIMSLCDQVSKMHVDVDQATIYRIVENFIKKDLIVKLQFQEKKFYYEAKMKDHHHAVCHMCGKIEDISNCSIPRIEREIEKTRGFKVASHSLEFFGICRSCQNL